jgi:hypothetical protein
MHGMKIYSYTVNRQGYGSYIVGSSDSVDAALTDARAKLAAYGVKKFDGFTINVHRTCDGARVASRNP